MQKVRENLVPFDIDKNCYTVGTLLDASFVCANISKGGFSRCEAFARDLHLRADSVLGQKSEPRACRKDKHVDEDPSLTTEKGHRFGVLFLFDKRVKRRLNKGKNEQKVSKLSDNPFLFLQPSICFLKPFYDKVA